MKIGRLENYPLQQEMVSAVCLVAVLYSAWTNFSNLPHTIAVHFDWNGDPNGYSSKGFALALILGLLAFQWVVDSAVRYQFVRAESKQKRFNWIQFLTVPGVMAVAGSWLAIVDFNLNGGPFQIGWKGVFGWLGLAFIYLFLTEKLRPQGESDFQPFSNIGEDLVVELPERFCLIDHVVPRWWFHLMLWPGLLTTLGGVAMLLVADPLVLVSGVATILGGLLMLLFADGFKFVLHQNGLEVQLGTLSFPIKRISKEEIQGYEIKEFNALADFGGWGLKWGRDNTTGYILSGNVGLLIKTERRNYLVGTEQSRAFYCAVDQLMRR